MDETDWTDTMGSRGPDLPRLLLVAGIGLLGCAITIVATAQPEAVTTTKLVGTLAGLFLSFVGVAGVVDAVRGPR